MTGEMWEWNILAVAVYVKHLSAAQREITALDLGIAVDLECQLAVEGELTNQVIRLMDDDRYGVAFDEDKA